MQCSANCKRTSDPNTYEDYPMNRSNQLPKSKPLVIPPNNKKTAPPPPPRRGSVLTSSLSKSASNNFSKKGIAKVSPMSCPKDFRMFRTKSSPTHHGFLVNRLPAKAAMRMSIISKLQPPDEPIQLKEFIVRYSTSLPMQVRVENGYCSDATDLLIANDEKFNFHFIKHTKVITVTDMKGVEMFTLPLNSSIEFGLLYNPNNNVEEAEAGFLFETAGSIMAMKSLPHVVCATRAYYGSKPQMSVSENEVLIVKEVKPGPRGKGKSLIVHSLYHGEKILSEKCAGSFTTIPRRNKLTISEMLQHSIPFPQSAIMFQDREIDSFLPLSMINSPVILKKLKGETSVIATGPSVDDGEMTTMFQFASDLDIQVQPVSLDESEQRKLRVETRKLFESFDVSNVQLFSDQPSSRAYELQSLLNKKVLHEEKMDGIQLMYRSPLTSCVSFEDSDTEDSFSGEDCAPSASAEKASTPVHIPAVNTVPNAPESNPPTSAVPSPSHGVYQSPRPVASLSAQQQQLSASTYQLIDRSKLDPGASDYVQMNPTEMLGHDPNAATSTPSIEVRVAAVELGYMKLQNKVENLSQQMQQLTVKVDQLEKSVKNANSKKPSDFDHLSTWCGKLQEEIRELQVHSLKPRPLPRQRSPQPHHNAAVAVAPITNPKEFLKSLTGNQVCDSNA